MHKAQGGFICKAHTKTRNLVFFYQKHKYLLKKAIHWCIIYYISYCFGGIDEN